MSFKRIKGVGSFTWKGLELDKIFIGDRVRFSRGGRGWGLGKRGLGLGRRGG